MYVVIYNVVVFIILNFSYSFVYVILMNIKKKLSKMLIRWSILHIVIGLWCCRLTTYAVEYINKYLKGNADKARWFYKSRLSLMLNAVLMGNLSIANYVSRRHHMMSNHETIKLKASSYNVLTGCNVLSSR